MNSLLSSFSSSNTSVFDSCPSSSNFTQFVHDAQSFLLLLAHIEEISWSLIRLSSSSDGSILTLHHTYIDLGDRLHDLYIDIPQRWPNERPRCRTNLPVEFNIEIWCSKTSRLIEIINNFHSVVDSLQSFWAQLTELERDAIVLDEKPISYASTTRRLKINDNVHVQIQVRHLTLLGERSQVIQKFCVDTFSISEIQRWKSEYQTTYKPFWRFDFKNGKWYKDAAAEESGFNPNLFWYKELMSTRKRADEYRANAEADHFNRNHTLQLQTGYGGTKSYLAWDTHDDNDTDSIISIDRDLERRRQREREIQRQIDERIQSKIHHYQDKRYERPSSVQKTDQIAQTDHQVDRVVYIDEPIPKVPSVATKAFVRNLNSSSVQQNMSWDAESLYTQRTNSDIDFKSNIARDLHRKHYTNDESNVIRQASSIKQDNRGTSTHSPLINERQQANHVYTSPHTNERTIQHNDIIRPSTSFQETRHAAGRSSYDTHIFDKRLPIRPHTSMNDYHSYHGNRYKDKIIDNNNYDNHQQEYSPTSTSPFQVHLDRLDERFGQNSNARHKDDDVLSVNSVRSLSSSCSLASQTLERAQQNMNKYWGGHSPASIDSPKKPCSAKH
ncbi:unnamed protein product [Rotaria sp. Silwood2]|nr:unnamed protein product [Rotaria sp. Silwood2]